MPVGLTGHLAPSNMRATSMPVRPPRSQASSVSPMLTASRACGLLLAFAATLTACSKAPEPLAPQLQAIRCPTNKTAHASGSFAKGRVMFVCIAKEMAEAPHLLRCDLESRPMICEDEGSLVFSRTPAGVIYPTYFPAGKREMDVETMTGAWRLTVNFRASPPRTETFEEVETDWRFMIPEAGRLLPPGFTLVKGALCDRKTTVLGSATCNLEARSASLYWHIAVSYLGEPGVPVHAEEYKEAMEQWLKLLGLLVTDPAKK